MFVEFSVKKWMYIHLIGQIFVILWATHFYHTIIGMFIPIAGRSGGNHNPDIMISVLTCFLTLFITSYMVNNQSFFHLNKNKLL